jgi:hypothetical protein
MMKEVMRLGNQHSALLHKFIISQHQTGVRILHEAQRKDLYLQNPDGLALACIVENKQIEQVFLVTFASGCATTRIYGTFTPATLDILDLLCAYCSSRTPMIETHELICQPEKSNELREIYAKCRLGRYTSEQKEYTMIKGSNLLVLATKVCYPK